MSFLKKGSDLDAVKVRIAASQGIQLYFVKYLGKQQVYETQGQQVCELAMRKLCNITAERRSRGLSPPKVEVSLSIKGVKANSRADGSVHFDIPLQCISFCHNDRHNNLFFAFISQDELKSPMFCHVFETKGQASEIMTAFSFIFKQALEDNKDKEQRQHPAPKAGGGPAVTSEVDRLKRELMLQQQEALAMRRRLEELEGPAPKGRGSAHPNPGNRIPSEQQQPSQQSFDPERIFESEFKMAKARVASISRSESAGGREFESAFATKLASQSNATGVANTGEGGGLNRLAVGASPLVRPAPASVPPSTAIITVPPIVGPFVSQKSVNAASKNPNARLRGAPPPESSNGVPPTKAAASALSLHNSARRSIRHAIPEGAGALPVKNNPNPTVDRSVVSGGDGFAAFQKRAPESKEDIGGASIDGFTHASYTGNDPFAHDDELDEVNYDIPIKRLSLQPQGVSRVPAQGVSRAPVAVDSALARLSRHVFSLANPDDEGCLAGGTLRPLMLMSKLPAATLAQIWQMVDLGSEDNEIPRGKLDLRQLTLMLGLLGQAQRGENLDISIVKGGVLPPNLEGLAAMTSDGSDA